MKGKTGKTIRSKNTSKPPRYTILTPDIIDANKGFLGTNGKY